MEHCEKEKDIERLVKTVFGNGSKGIIQLLTKALQQLEHNNETTEELRKSVSAHTKLLAEMGGFKEGSKTGKTIIRWLIGLTVTLTGVIVTMGAIIVNLI